MPCAALKVRRHALADYDIDLAILDDGDAAARPNGCKRRLRCRPGFSRRVVPSLFYLSLSLHYEKAMTNFCFFGSQKALRMPKPELLWCGLLLPLPPPAHTLHYRRCLLISHTAEYLYEAKMIFITPPAKAQFSGYDTFYLRLPAAAFSLHTILSQLPATAARAGIACRTPWDHAFVTLFRWPIHFSRALYFP